MTNTIYNTLLNRYFNLFFVEQLINDVCRGILSWYLMMGNTDFMFDGPQSRENESHVYESEQLVCNPPEEFRNSTTLQYFIGRSCFLKVRI